MKKILSLALVIVLFISAIPVCFAIQTEGNDVSVENGTDVLLQGKYASSTYVITVPAQLSPGESGHVHVQGAWSENETLSISCPDKVVLTNTKNGNTIDVSVMFDGLNQGGNLYEEFDVSLNISIENVTVMFGTWTGHLDYEVSFISSEPVIINFSYDYIPLQAEQGSTWNEWVNSSYNTIGILMEQGRVLDENRRVVCDSMDADRQPVDVSDIIIAEKEYGPE